MAVRHDGLASLRSEPVEVDAPAPQSHAVHTEPAQLRHGRGGRREGERRSPVQATDVRRHQRRAPGHTVLRRVGDHVGLVDRHARQPQQVRRGLSVPAEHEGRREMHDVRFELREQTGHPRSGRHGDPHLRIRRQRQRADLRGPCARPLDLGAPRAGGDDQRLVPAALQVRHHLENGVRDAVHMGEERFGQQRDSHISRVPGMPRPTTQKRRVRRRVHHLLAWR